MARRIAWRRVWRSCQAVGFAPRAVFRPGLRTGERIISCHIARTPLQGDASPDGGLRQDPAPHRASRWIRVGQAPGRGRYDSGNEWAEPGKYIWLRPPRRTESCGKVAGATRHEMSRSHGGPHHSGYTDQRLLSLRSIAQPAEVLGSKLRKVA